MRPRSTLFIHRRNLPLGAQLRANRDTKKPPSTKTYMLSSHGGVANIPRDCRMCSASVIKLVGKRWFS